MVAAKTIYHFQIVNIFFSIIAIPFIGILAAHEDMIVTASVSVVQAVLTLGIAFLLPYLDGDRLIVYGLFLTSLSFLSLVFYGYYCFIKFPEYKFSRKHVNFPMMKIQMSYLGWNSIGLFVMISRNHGLAVMLNLFFGTKINASYGLANQINGQLNNFSGNILSALYPQIVKSEGAGDSEKMIRLSLIGSKYGFFMFALFAIPCLFEMEALLVFWLKSIPPHAVMFCRYILLATLCRQLTSGLPSAIQATGHIKMYQLLLSGCWVMSLPIAYFLLSSGYQLSYVMLSYVFFELVACGIRLYVLKKLVSMSTLYYFQKTIYKLWLPTIIYCICCVIIVTFTNFTGRFWLTGIIPGPLYIIAIYYFGIDTTERLHLKEVLDSMLRKLK